MQQQRLYLCSYDRIKEELKEEKMTAALEGWVNDLRKNARIEINQDLL